MEKVASKQINDLEITQLLFLQVWNIKACSNKKRITSDKNKTTIFF